MGCNIKRKANNPNKHIEKPNKHIKNLRSKFLINLEQLTEIMNKLDMLMAGEHLNVVEAKFAIEQYKNYLIYCELKSKEEDLSENTIEEYLENEKELKRMVT